ncbi:hypothetical protein OAQ99_01050 [Candidatus Kapabacteria bacterium]|nr:hypothetical protein [Candidatus Kapabacteria bacterium]
MKILINYLILIILFLQASYTQDSKHLEISEKSWGDKFLKNTGFPKRVYIMDFTVSYQLLVNLIKPKSLKNKNSKAKQLLLGITSLDEIDLKQITDSLYNNFLNSLREKGYIPTSLDLVSESNIWENYELIKGGVPQKTKYNGVVKYSPSHEKYYRRKERKLFDFISRSRASNHPHEIAEEFNIAVARVHLIFSITDNSILDFSNNSKKTKRDSKLKIITNLKLNKLSEIDFKYPNSNFSFKLKDNLLINNVIENKEYGTVKRVNNTKKMNLGSLNFFSNHKDSYKNLQVIDCIPIDFQNESIGATKLFFNEVLKSMNNKY